MNRSLKICFGGCLLLSGLFFMGCQQDHNADPDPFGANNAPDKSEQLSLEERAQRHVTSQLGIPVTEKYDLQIYRKDLDGDPNEDAIITVNLLERAIDRAAASPNTAKLAEIGFMGNYNYFFYYDGGLDKISPPILVPSSAKAPLVVHFDRVFSEAHYDVQIDYHIKDALFRNFYTVNNHTPMEVYQGKLYDKLGSPGQEAFVFEYEPGSISKARDILTYKGKITNYKPGTDLFHFKAQIVRDGGLVMSAFFNPRDNKYYIRTDGMIKPEQ